MAHAYSPNFRVTETLRDGTAVLVRSVLPDDKNLIADGFAQLSEFARYRRFLHHKSRLTSQELRFLTELDGTDHYALGVVDLSSEQPVGIGRLVRDRTVGSTTAEIAVVVMDAHQGRGVGRLMLEHLVVAARERGITHLRFTMLGDNEPMRRLVQSVLGTLRLVERDGPTITIEVDVPPQTAHPLHHLRRMAELGWKTQLEAAQWLGRQVKLRAQP